MKSGAESGKAGVASSKSGNESGFADELSFMLVTTPAECRGVIIFIHCALPHGLACQPLRGTADSFVSGKMPYCAQPCGFACQPLRGLATSPAECRGVIIVVW